MVEKTWYEDEINNQNGMTLYKSGSTPVNIFRIRVVKPCVCSQFLQKATIVHKACDLLLQKINLRNSFPSCQQTFRMEKLTHDLFEELPLPEMNCQELHSAIMYPLKAKLEPLYRKPRGRILAANVKNNFHISFCILVAPFL